MRRKIAYSISLICLISFLGVKNVLAVTSSISNVPQLISTEPFTLNVKISGASVGTNYLRIDLYKPSTTNYFGETFNGSGWYAGSDHTQHYSITIQSGTDWSGEIQGRLGNLNSTQYDGPGAYKLRVRRYTSSGNYNTTEANNSAVDVSINVSVATSTPTTAPTITQEPILNPSPTLTLATTVIEIQSPTSNFQPQTYNNIYISEVMIDPETGSNEWVEIYNGNDYQVILSDWYIDDIENSGSTTKKFSLTILAHSYGMYELSTSIFNNDGDSVRLLDFSQKELDSFQYQSSEKGKTLGRTSFDNDSFCLQTPSKNTSNGPCINPSATLTSKSITSSTSTIAPTNTPVKTPTITIRPTKTSLTVTPVNFSLFSQNQPSDSDSSEESTSEVLGITTQNEPTINSSNRALLSSLSFASFGYSALAIVSILIKLKMNS